MLLVSHFVCRAVVGQCGQMLLVSHLVCRAVVGQYLKLVIDLVLVSSIVHVGFQISPYRNIIILTDSTILSKSWLPVEYLIIGQFFNHAKLAVRSLLQNNLH